MKKKLYILINLLNIIDSKGRLYYDAKFFNTQILSHQLTIINNIANKTPLINRQCLFYIMLKKDNKRLFTPLQPFNQLITPKFLFPAKVVDADMEKALSDFLLAITYHLAI